MGTPVPGPFDPPDSPAGDACPNCWGAGKPFGDGDTPDTIWVNFSGVAKGPFWQPSDGDPIDGLFECTQYPPNPCQYNHPSIPWDIKITFTPAWTNIFVIKAFVGTVWNSFSADPCELFNYNPLRNKFIGGTALITIPGVS